MKRFALAGIVLAASAASAWAESRGYTLADSRIETGASARRLEKVLVIGISDDREVRNRFEDKFVSHLRGKGIMATASHTLVPDLAKPGDRDELLAALAEEKLDGAVTVRTVPLDKIGEAEWAAAWSAWADAPSTVADLVRKTIPVGKKRAKRYGIEFALWDLSSRQPVWAARTGAQSLREIQSGVGDLLQLAIAALRDTVWLGPRPNASD